MGFRVVSWGLQGSGLLLSPNPVLRSCRPSLKSPRTPRASKGLGSLLVPLRKLIQEEAPSIPGGVADVEGQQRFPPGSGAPRRFSEQSEIPRRIHLHLGQERTPGLLRSLAQLPLVLPQEGSLSKRCTFASQDNFKQTPRQEPRLQSLTGWRRSPFLGFEVTRKNKVHTFIFYKGSLKV